MVNSPQAYLNLGGCSFVFAMIHDKNVQKRLKFFFGLLVSQFIFLLLQLLTG